MNFKLVLAICILSSFGLVDTVSGQISIGGQADQKNINVFIDDQEKIRIVHELGASGSPVSVKLINGTASEIQVTDNEGNKIEHGVSAGLDQTVITIFSSSSDIFVEYKLTDVMYKKYGTTQTWNFLYPTSIPVTFSFPESVELVFVNDRPVYFKNENRFNCHGCEMILEFVYDEKKIIEKVLWDDREFDVQIWASTELHSFNFDQSTKSIRYDFDDSEKLVTLIIPLELLGGPYQTLLDDEKIFMRGFQLDEENYGISLKLNKAGTVHIIGTTVIPEFPVIIPIMLIGITMIIIMQFRNKLIVR